MTHKELLKAIGKINASSADLDGLIAGSRDNMLRSLVSAEKRIMARVTELVADMPNLNAVKANQRIQYYLGERKALWDAFGESGYLDDISKFVDGHDAVAELTGKLLKAGKIPADFTRIPQSMITMIKNRDMVYFRELNVAARNQIDKILMSQIIGGRTPKDALKVLRGAITGEYAWGTRQGVYSWHAGTYVRTAHNRASRAYIQAARTDYGLDTFLYSGPILSNTRAFCLAIVGGVYTADQVDQMDNGQVGDVWTDGGGYNCGHKMIPVSKELADAIKEAEGVEG